MSIFASIDPDVRAQYALLEDVLTPELAPEETIKDAAHEYALKVLGTLVGDTDLPPDGSELDRTQGARLLKQFRDLLITTTLDPGGTPRGISAGDVAFNFSCLVYYVAGKAATSLTPLQHDILLEACDIAELRPLPVIRWTEFVRANVSDPARVRTIMRTCIYSKTVLGMRLMNVMGDLARQLKLPSSLNILAIGSSGTVQDALFGLRTQREGKVFLAHPTPGAALSKRQFGFDVVEIDDAEATSGRIRFDLIVMGCGAIGKTSRNEIEAVSWARDIALAKKVKEFKVPLFVVGGLYKIWPRAFYESHRDFAVNIRRDSSDATSDAILTKGDIDWLVTEHEAVNFIGSNRPRWVQFLLEARSLDVAAGLSLCANKTKFIQHILNSESLEKIDHTLGRLSKDDRPLFEKYLRHPEDYEYIRTNVLPSQFLAAQRQYEHLVDNPEWRRQYAGQFIAILGDDFRMIQGDSLDAVLDQAYTEWGYRPIFHSFVHGAVEAPSVFPPPEPSH